MTAPSPPERGALGLILLLGGLTAVGPLSIDAYLPALPELARDMNASAAAAQLTLSTFFLGLAVSQLFWGPYADRVGRRRPILLGLSLYTLASLASALAPSIELLAVARFFQAVGGAAGLVVARAIVRDRWSGREAARIMSLLILVMGAAPVLAPTLGSALLAVAGWRAIFVALVCFGVLGFAAVYFTLEETASERRPEPLLEAAGRILRDRLFVTASLGGGLAQAGLFAYIAGSSFVFVDYHGLTPTVFAWLFGANAFGLIAASQVNRWALRYAEPGTIAMIAVSVGLVAATTLWLFAHSRSLPLHAVCVFLFVGAYGLTGSNATALALEGQRQRAGFASALLGSLQYTISALATVAVGLLSNGTPVAMASVMTFAALGSLTFLWRARLRARESTSPVPAVRSASSAPTAGAPRPS